MPNLYEISNEINPQTIISKYISLLCEKTERNTIVYYSGWLNHTQLKKGSEIKALQDNDIKLGGII